MQWDSTTTWSNKISKKRSKLSAKCIKVLLTNTTLTQSWTANILEQSTDPKAGVDNFV